MRRNILHKYETPVLEPMGELDMDIVTESWSDGSMADEWNNLGEF